MVHFCTPYFRGCGGKAANEPSHFLIKKARRDPFFRPVSHWALPFFGLPSRVQNAQMVFPFVRYPLSPVGYVAQLSTSVRIDDIYTRVQALTGETGIPAPAADECIHGHFHEDSERGRTAPLFRRE